MIGVKNSPTLTHDDRRGILGEMFIVSLLPADYVDTNTANTSSTSSVLGTRCKGQYCIEFGALTSLPVIMRDYTIRFRQRSFQNIVYEYRLLLVYPSTL